jgi:ABC-type Fe3+-hydroxamate transport system substrate-binding protein
MLAGANTFINEMLETAGFSNIINDEQSRYPEISIDQLKSLKPKYLLLSTEPFPFNLDDVQKLEAETGIKTLLVDGEMFSWYGSRLEKFGNYILDLMP